MKRVVVTGASGFIGRHVLPFLVDAGFEVHALCQRGEFTKVDGVSWHKVDLMDYHAVDVLLHELQATHFLHLAWYTEHGKFWHAAENLQWVGCSLNLLKCFVKYGGERVVMAGSCAEYDWSAGRCFEQETVCNPATLYGVSKHALYQVAELYCKQNNVSFAWGRVFFLYGPGEAASRFVPTVINGILKHEKTPCSAGTQVRDFMHVEDVASAFSSLLASDLIGAVNIASGKSYTLREIGEEIMCQMNGNGWIEFGALPNRLDDPISLTADTSRLQVELDWRPSYSLSKGLAGAINWWKLGLDNLNQENGTLEGNNGS
ncbi:MAG: epimerase [Flavobacteriaceae bacterium]|nr:MAG: epimerase [Flavobacteriaceae bacterium]